MKFFVSIVIAFTCLHPRIARSNDFSSWPLFNASISAAAHVTNQNNWDRVPWDSNLARYRLQSAPTCETDIYNNFSVSKALAYISQLENLLLSKNFEVGRRWDYPEMGTAEELIRQAGVQLEQVMNYGILKFIDYCITCNPENYLSAAQRLIIATRKVYGEVDGTRNFGLVQSVIWWLNDPNARKYCGDYSKQTTPPGWLIGDWVFGKDNDASPTCDQLSLTSATGQYGRNIEKKCANYSGLSESFYWLLGNKIVFVDPIGRITSSLDKYTPSAPTDTTYFFGTSYPDDSFGLYLYSTCSGTVTRGSLEWQRCGSEDKYAEPGSEGYSYTATQYCQDLELNSFNDWRLPTFEELADLVYCSTGRKNDWEYSQCNDDSLKPTIYPEFQAENDSYYTSSNSQSDPDLASGWYYHIYFGGGGYDTYSAGRDFYVRCVRDK